MQRFSLEQLNTLDLVVGHLMMLEYGMSQKFSPELEKYGITLPVQRLYNTFALMHLITTMFLLDKKDHLLMGGFCYQALNSLGLADKLEPLRKTFDGKVGKTTLGEYIRLSRNKLATHGDLTVFSLPPAVQDASGSPRAIAQFDRLMEKLDGQTTRLRIILENRMKRERAYHKKQA